MNKFILLGVWVLYGDAIYRGHWWPMVLQHYIGKVIWGMVVIHALCYHPGPSLTLQITLDDRMFLYCSFVNPICKYDQPWTCDHTPTNVFYFHVSDINKDRHLVLLSKWNTVYGSNCGFLLKLFDFVCKSFQLRYWMEKFNALVTCSPSLSHHLPAPLFSDPCHTHWNTSWIFCRFFEVSC